MGYDFNKYPHPRGAQERLRLKIQTLQEALDNYEAEVHPLRDLARAVIRDDHAEVDRLIPIVQKVMNTQQKTAYRTYTPEFKTEICRQYRAAQGEHGRCARLLTKYSLHAATVAHWLKQYDEHGASSFYEKWQAGSAEGDKGNPGRKMRTELKVLRKKYGLPANQYTCGAAKSVPVSRERELSKAEAHKNELDAEKSHALETDALRESVSTDLLALLGGGILPPERPK